MISEIIMMVTVFWSMPFFVPDGEGGYQKWTLEVVDVLCNGIECAGGLTSAYPIATVQILEVYVYDTESVGPYGCTVFMHEMWHVWYGDWNHEIMGWCSQ